MKFAASSLYDFTMPALNGSPTPLAGFKGNEGLQALFVIAGFPANQARMRRSVESTLKK